jgi:tRNA A-37 threonylcarbamoyl transferase component Bud32
MCSSNPKDEPRPSLCDAPNQYTRPAQVELYDDMAIFHGYQEFVLTSNTVSVLPDDLALQKKQELLTSYFSPRYLSQRTVLDLGASAGFFSFWAVQSGAEQAIAVDMDVDYVKIMEEAVTKLGFQNVESRAANIVDWNEPADVVLALALIHWIYSCTSLLGSLDRAIERLAKLTKYMLIVEWVDPEDPAIAFFHHVDQNKEFTQGPYTLKAFETALDCHFARYQIIDHVSPTRKLYAAFRSSNEIDLSGPLPLIMPKESIICCRYLATNAGIDYWGCVYNDGNVIYKQATLDLAEREAYFLSQLDSDYFPRVIDVRTEGGYSLAAIEKIDGLPLLKAVPDISITFTKLYHFIQHCLNLLGELRHKGIMHRDVRPDNILVRDGMPVLIDFAWAISDAHPYFTPKDLNYFVRPPDGSSSDLYSMGKIFEQINQHRYPELDVVIELMTEPDPSLRITDLGILRVLFSSIGRSSGA